MRKPESDAFEPTEVTNLPEVGKFMTKEQQVTLSLHAHCFFI